MSDMLQLGQQVLQSQPFSRLLGTQLTAYSENSVELTIPIRPELFQHHGTVHGGVISYAADNALTFAGGLVLGPKVVTAEYSIHYLKPAQGERLIARATVVSSGRRQAVCRCDILVATGEEEILCAIAHGTIVSLA